MRVDWHPGHRAQWRKELEKGEPGAVAIMERSVDAMKALTDLAQEKAHTWIKEAAVITEKTVELDKESNIVTP